MQLIFIVSCTHHRRASRPSQDHLVPSPSPDAWVAGAIQTTEETYPCRPIVSPHHGYSPDRPVFRPYLDCIPSSMAETLFCPYEAETHVCVVGNQTESASVGESMIASCGVDCLPTSPSLNLMNRKNWSWTRMKIRPLRVLFSAP
jgi:hypothetical protein